MSEANKEGIIYVDGIESFVCSKNFAITKLTKPDDDEFPYLIATEIVVDGCEQNEYLTVKSCADTDNYVSFSRDDLIELKKLIDHIIKES